MFRILHVVTTMNRGGLETMLMNYYRNIDRTKIQFDFLTHSNEYFDYEDEIKQLGGKIFRVSRLVPWSRIYKNQLRNFFNNHSEYKAIHVHQDCLSAVALKVAEECDIPVRIAHSHNSNQDFNLKYFIKRFYMKKIPKYATELFSCGKKAGDWMFTGSTYHILNNAIDSEQFVYSKETSKKIKTQFNLKDEFIVGHVGRFNHQKNHLFLLKIFKELLMIVPNAKLMLVGEGNLENEIKKRAEELKILEHIIFTGVRDDVNNILQAMDVFVLPSLYEGLPVVMVEAQAAGLPCVISDRVPDESIITKGLVTVKKLSDSSKKWAEHIVKQSKQGHTDHRQEIIDNGYDIVEAAKRLENFYLSKIS